MDERNSYTDPETDQINVARERDDMVSRFQLHIDEAEYGPGDVSFSEKRPVYKGEVYFANHSKSGIGPGQTRPVQQQKPVRTPREDAPVSRQPVKKSTTSSSASGKKKKKKKKKASYLSATAKVLISIFLCTAILSGIGISTVNDILAIGRKAETVEIELPENASTNEVIDILHDAGLVKRPLLCKVFTTLETKMRHGSEPKYIAGMINVRANMGLEGLLNRVKLNQQLTQTVTLYFPEGWTAKQIFDKLQKYKVCDADYLYKAVQNINFNYGFLKSAKDANSTDRYLLLEGYLFPDTYEFFVDYNANSVIERFLARFDEIWTPEYQKRADELGLTTDEVIRIASIIQREAANKDQMSVVSSVLHNRLNHPVSYPTLDCDSTYNYIDNYVTPVVGDMRGGNYRSHYNTYVCDRLPAGSICNPGQDAIQAALYPDDTEYYYFAHDKKGNIYLAKTNAEHNRNRSEIKLKNAGL